MQAPAAHEAVARKLESMGVKAARGQAGKAIIARTIRGWCEEVSADVGRHGEGAQAYDELINDPKGSTTNDLLPKQAQTVLLDRLAALAKKIRAQEGA